ncbi:response regulator transcription factor [Luteolibacter sp. SL250]|nr:response regulator transcription factor [Luteolibacter sp. SL250]WAC21491.1 response regulator transcription factor [Luteolibacter sp. SL250]
MLIVEDVAETRRWLSGVVLAAFKDSTILEAATVDAARELSGQHVFDLALIDLGLPDGSGLDVLRSLRAVSPSTLCVITTAIGEDSHIVAALSAGAQGYLLKQQPVGQLSRQLVQLHEGIPALSPSIARRIMEHFRMTGPVADDDAGLSEREKQTLALISRGFRNVDVAENLGIAESTVASHIKAIYRKLDISTRAEASWHATRLGL